MSHTDIHLSISSQMMNIPPVHCIPNKIHLIPLPTSHWLQFVWGVGSRCFSRPASELIYQCKCAVSFQLLKEEEKLYCDYTKLIWTVFDNYTTILLAELKSYVFAVKKKSAAELLKVANYLRWILTDVRFLVIVGFVNLFYACVIFSTNEHVQPNESLLQVNLKRHIQKDRSLL